MSKEELEAFKLGVLFATPKVGGFHRTLSSLEPKDSPSGRIWIERPLNDYEIARAADDFKHELEVVARGKGAIK